ncbi:hypothetical protein Dimus_018605 [Dionaea muscipula]
MIVIHLKKKDIVKSKVRGIEIEFDHEKLATILGVPGANGICEYIKEVWEESKYTKPLEITRRFANDENIMAARRVKARTEQPPLRPPPPSPIRTTAGALSALSSPAKSWSNRGPPISSKDRAPPLAPSSGRSTPACSRPPPHRVGATSPPDNFSSLPADSDLSSPGSPRRRACHLRPDPERATPNSITGLVRPWVSSISPS